MHLFIIVGCVINKWPSVCGVWGSGQDVIRLGSSPYNPPPPVLLYFLVFFYNTCNCNCFCYTLVWQTLVAQLFLFSLTQNQEQNTSEEQWKYSNTRLKYILHAFIYFLYYLNISNVCRKLLQQKKNISSSCC